MTPALGHGADGDHRAAHPHVELEQPSAPRVQEGLGLGLRQLASGRSGTGRRALSAASACRCGWLRDGRSECGVEVAW